MDRRTQPRITPVTRHSLELYRILVESVSDYAIFALDTSGRILSWNRGAERFKGYAADRIIGKHFSVFYPSEDVAAGKPDWELEVAAAEGRFEDEGWRLREDGSRFWANVIITALRDEHGELIGFAKVTRDLTTRREMEEQGRRLAAEEAALAEAERHGEELTQLNEQLQNQAVELEAQTEEAQALLEELEQTNEALQQALDQAEETRAAAERAAREAAEANRAKSDFLAMMSHELRTPLNAIAGYAELVEMGVHGPITEPQRDALMRIQRNQRHLLSLINDVLNFTRLEAGHVSVTLAPTPVTGLVAGLEGLIAPQLRAKRLTYVATDAPAELEVLADHDKAVQILLNLLSNAIKFTGADGRIEVSAERAGERVAIHVRDTGIGIPEDRQRAVFEPFVQVGREYASGQGGTGLGLSISRDLAHMMKGDLTVESEPGRGSTFTLWLREAQAAGRKAHD